MLLPFVILTYVSHHALAVQVEVYEGARSVLLPCRVPFVLEDTTVMWERYDLNPTTVHRRHEDRDELDDQNQRYSGRTSVALDESEPGDLSLTLIKPQEPDSGNYTCIISKRTEQLRLRIVQLKVKVSKVEVTVEQESESVHLPCPSPPPLPEDTTVEWTRSDTMMVHIYPNSSNSHKQQDERFCSRTQMNADLLKSGDLGVTLKYPTERDSGEYTCTVYRDGDVLRQRVELRCTREKISTWAKFLLVLLAFGLFAGGASAVYFWQSFTKVSKVEVNAGVDSVLLPFETNSPPPQDITVEWTRFGLIPAVVHMYQDQKDQPAKQNQIYLNRTSVAEPVPNGDFSLTLKHPKHQDSGLYICTVSNGRVLHKTHVRLQVRVPDVMAVEGDESVVLCCKTKVPLAPDDLVEWSRNKPWPMIVHVFQNGCDLPEKQNWFYRSRTKVDVKNKAVSLTLKDPTLFDTCTYICTVSRDGRVMVTRKVRLHIKDTNQTQDDTSNSDEISNSTPLLDGGAE